jgi:hypothetical protein
MIARMFRNKRGRQLRRPYYLRRLRSHASLISKTMIVTMVVTTIGPANIATSVSIFSGAAADRATRAIHPQARRFQPDAPFVSWHRAQVRASMELPEFRRCSILLIIEKLVR